MVVTSKLISVLGKWQQEHNEVLSLRDLEERTGISRTFLSRFQNNRIKKLDLDSLGKLCSFFGVQPGELLEYVPDEA